MDQARPLLRWAGMMWVAAAVAFLGFEAWGAKAAGTPPGNGRSDLIRIDHLAAVGTTEMPAVVFFHDKHTDALAKEGKGCDTCHFMEGRRLNLVFKRRPETKPAEFKNIYHTNCIGCHQETLAAGKKSGPLDGFCRDCHVPRPTAAPLPLDAGMNKVLHFRHLNSKDIPSATTEKDNCGVCHHRVDEQAKKLVYMKGQEDSCRVCHGGERKPEVRPLRQAAHEQCVVCHLTLAQKGVKEPVPVRCADCHSAQGQAVTARNNQKALERLPGKEVPRLMRGQPDAALITYDPRAEGNKTPKAAMNPVPFDHLTHEKASDSCRACHHAGIGSCAACHTLGGAKAGGMVTLEQAMHQKASTYSCFGCHTAETAAPQCAGCHSDMAAKKADEASCKQCHLPPPQGVSAAAAAGLPASQKAAMAATLLQGRHVTAGTYPPQEIPDKVVIKELEDKYEPVAFAHRKHVETLLKGVKDNKLAGYFHRDPGTLCQGCHHNSPASKTPPGCVSCHAKTVGQAGFDPREANRPGLLAALHGQCMSCHREMQVKPQATACVECHKEKKK
jgi:hypothetical protein